jgi:hypothetical protein
VARHDTLTALDPLEATADLVLTAADNWRTNRQTWSEADRLLENRLWLELLDLYDSRHRPAASHDDVVQAAATLVAVADRNPDLLTRVWPLMAAMRVLRSQVRSVA